MLIRDDDVFLLGGKYTSHTEVVERFKQIHQIIANEGAIHIAALICGTLNQFPGGIDFLKQAYEKKELIPEIHGWEHTNYGVLNIKEIINHLNKCIETIETNFNYHPTKFYTPWGANDKHIKEASNMVGLELIDCSNILYPKRKYFGGKAWKEYSELVRLNKQELFIHWYEDKWFTVESHNLVKTLRTIRENKKLFIN